jgi:hypothetical protein
MKLVWTSAGRETPPEKKKHGAPSEIGLAAAKKLKRKTKPCWIDEMASRKSP